MVMEAPFIPENLLSEVFRQAENEYPGECCGFLFASKDSMETISAVSACRNAQDDFHSKDPINFPRSSKNAYYMDPADLLAAHKRVRSRCEVIRVIYHSHIDAAAYFSEEDKRNAVFGEEPLYPEADYLVVSVRAGKASEYGLFRWNSVSRDFECLKNCSLNEPR